MFIYILIIIQIFYKNLDAYEFYKKYIQIDNKGNYLYIPDQTCHPFRFKPATYSG